MGNILSQLQSGAPPAPTPATPTPATPAPATPTAPTTATPTPPQTSVPGAKPKPTAAQLEDCKRKIDASVAEKKRNAPTRTRGPPYVLFHPAGTEVRGLVLMHHGYSGEPYGMRILSAFLYRQGFNVFSTMIAGHIYNGEYYPATYLKDEYGGKSLKASLAGDAKAQQLLGESEKNPAKIPELLQRLHEVDTNFAKIPLDEYMAAAQNHDDPNFDKFFKSNHDDYLKEAQADLKLVEAHPGPVMSVGLSVGGAVSIALAGANPDRITHCIAMTPLLELYEQFPGTKRTSVNLVGPTDIAPDFAWSPSNPFPVAGFTANGHFGGTITSSSAFKKAFKSKVKMFMILTENEDAADIETNKKFYAECGGDGAGHVYHFYPRSYRVPHPLVDPTAESQGMTNTYWETMYQEIFRFLTTNKVVKAQLLKKEKDPSMPSPQPAREGWANYMAL